MNKEYELTGKIFGKWTVIKLSEPKLRRNGKIGNRYWICKCECGRTSKVPTYYLTKGYSTKCIYCAKHTKRIYKPDELPEVVWNKVKWNAKKRNIPISVDKDEAYEIFLKQNKKCKLTGLDIRIPLYGTDKEWTASLDRIDGKKGYEKDNLQWIHKDVNRMKNIFDDSYFIFICKKIVENYEK